MNRDSLNPCLTAKKIALFKNIQKSTLLEEPGSGSAKKQIAISPDWFLIAIRFADQIADRF